MPLSFPSNLYCDPATPDGNDTMRSVFYRVVADAVGRTLPIGRTPESFEHQGVLIRIEPVLHLTPCGPLAELWVYWRTRPGVALDPHFAKRAKLHVENGGRPTWIRGRALQSSDLLPTAFTQRSVARFAAEIARTLITAAKTAKRGPSDVSDLI